MKLTEQVVVEELAKVGYGGTQAQAAAAAIVKRAQLTELEVANAVDEGLARMRLGNVRASDTYRGMDHVVRRLAQ